MLRLLKLLELLPHFLALDVCIGEDDLVAAGQGWRLLVNRGPPVESQGARLHDLLGDAGALHLHRV